MKRSIFTTFFILCLSVAAMAQSVVYVNGTLYDGFGGTLSGKLVKYKLWAFDSTKNYIDSAQGSWVTGAGGVITQSISISPATRSGLITLSYMNCDSMQLQVTDTFSKYDSTVNFSGYACGVHKIIVTGRMKNSNNTSASNVKVYWYTDSATAAKHNYSLMQADTSLTDTGGYFTDTIYLKQGWYYGEIDAIFGCTSQTIVHNSYYVNGYTYTANLNIGTRTYCTIASPMASFSGVIRDQSTGQPVPYYTFYIKVDSVNTTGDSAIKAVMTDVAGTYTSSFSLGSGMSTVRYSLRLPNCGSLKVVSGTATTTSGSSNVNRIDSMCGSYDRDIQVSAVMYRVSGPAANVDILINMYDTLGNPIDTFHRQWSSNGNFIAHINIGYQYKAVDLELVFPGCMGQITTSKVRGRLSNTAVHFPGTYEYCNGDSKLTIYLQYSQPGPRSGTVYLIKADTLTTGGVLDTLLTLVDSAVVDSGYSAQFEVPRREYYAKFAPTNPADPFYNNMMATYYKDTAIYWGDGDTIALSRDSYRILKIRTGTNMGGPGFIGGALSSGANKTGNPIENVTIILYDASMKPLKTTLTDNSGAYSFNSLPYGTYYLLVDVPGRNATPTQVVISSQAPSMTSANFVVHKKYVESKFNTGIKTVSQNKLKAVYPNPASSQVTLEFGVAGAYTVEIYTLQGQKVLETKVDGSKALLSTDGLSTGVYLVRALDTRTGTILLDRLNIDK